MRKKKTVVVFHRHGPRPREQWNKLGADKPAPTKMQRSEHRRLQRQDGDDEYVIPASGLPAHVLLDGGE